MSESSKQNIRRFTDGKTISASQRRHLAEWCLFEKIAEGTEQRIEAYMDSLSDDDAQYALDSGWGSVWRDCQREELVK